eukprot:2852544-Pleurochrysis_carterae.AAC.4
MLLATFRSKSYDHTTVIHFSWLSSVLASSIRAICPHSSCPYKLKCTDKKRAMKRALKPALGYGRVTSKTKAHAR